MNSDTVPSILIIDDDQHVLKTTKMLLEQAGYNTFPCANAHDAVNTFKTSGIDVVLSDIKMPGMTGIELMEQIHVIEPEMPVVLFTAYADLETAVAAIKKDAFDFVIKPYDPDALVKCIGKAVMFQKFRCLERDYRNMLEIEVNEKTKELLLTVQELKKARDKAMESSRLKSEFLTNMSHEIRTPLNGMIGLTELSLEMELPQKLREYLEMIGSCAVSLNKLLGNILEISVLESGQVTISEKSFKVCDVIDRLAKAHQATASEKGLNLAFNIASDVPFVLKGDAGRLEQALSVLLDNAVKFTETGSVSLDVVKTESDDDTAVLLFSVADTGIGIPEDKLSSIFESFRQGDGSLTRKHGGAGLGLAIAERVVSMMESHMSVQSCVGKGSTFHFTLKFKT